jgi:hypothetical protein
MPRIQQVKISTRGVVSLREDLLIFLSSSMQIMKLSHGRRVLSSGIWRRVVRWKLTLVLQEHIVSILRVVNLAEWDNSVKAGGKQNIDVSEELMSSIFRVEKNPTKIPVWKQVAGIEAICSSWRSLDFQQTTRRYIPEDRPRHNHCCEILRPYTELYPRRWNSS